jgi:hypothetical protein
MASLGELVELGMNSEECLLGRTSQEEDLHGLTIVDNYVALLPFPVDATHHDDPIVLLGGPGPGHKDWLRGEHAVRQLLLDRLPGVHVQLDHGAIEVEHIV